MAQASSSEECVEQYLVRCNRDGHLCRNPSLGIHSVREFTSQGLTKSKLLIAANATQPKVLLRDLVG